MHEQQGWIKRITEADDRRNEATMRLLEISVEMHRYRRMVCDLIGQLVSKLVQQGHLDRFACIHPRTHLCVMQIGKRAFGQMKLITV